MSDRLAKFKQTLPGRAARKIVRVARKMAAEEIIAEEYYNPLVVTIGVNAKSRPKLKSLNPQASFEHRSFREFESGEDISLPDCAAIVIDTQFYNQRLIDYARAFHVLSESF